jgi:hypothetical protein
MLSIKKKYITDGGSQPVAVQVDIETFHKIEQILEDYALGKLIEENHDEDLLNLYEAETYYRQLKKE